MTIKKTYITKSHTKLTRVEKLYAVLITVILLLTAYLISSVFSKLENKTKNILTQKQVNVVFVVDCSASMNVKDDGYTTRATLAGRSVNSILTTGKSNIVNNHIIIFWENRVAKYNKESDKSNLSVNIGRGICPRNSNGYTPDGEKKVLEAVKQALNIINGSQRNKKLLRKEEGRIILLTDGVDEKQKTEIIKLLSKRGSNKNSLSVIGIGSERGGYFSVRRDEVIPYTNDNIFTAIEHKITTEKRFSRLDSKSLKDIAALGNGKYYTPDLSKEDVIKIIQGK